MLGYQSEEELKIQKILLDVARLNYNYRVDMEVMFNPLNTNFHVEQQIGRIGKEMVIRLEQKVASQALDTVSFHKPSSWWQHFKHDCFPNWLKNKFPVKFTYEEYKVSALYPKLAIQDGQHIIQVHKIGDKNWL